MAKVTMLRSDLYQIDQEIIEIRKNSKALSLLLNKSIELFYNRAAMHLKIMDSRESSIKERYIQKDDQGKFITITEGDKTKWKFIESKADLEKAEVLDVSMVEAAFNKEISAFMKQSITID